MNQKRKGRKPGCGLKRFCGQDFCQEAFRSGKNIHEPGRRGNIDQRKGQPFHVQESIAQHAAKAQGQKQELEKGRSDSAELSVPASEKTVAQAAAHEEVKKPEENPGNKRVARPKRKRGRPRKDEYEGAETQIDPVKPIEQKGENQNEISEGTN